MSKRLSKPKPKKPVPFEFVLEELETLELVGKPMFGCHAFYLGERILIILREKEDETDSNGVWIATEPAHHESLKKDLPSLTSIPLFGPGPTGWQMLPSGDARFEAEALKLCRLILKGDPRIGKIPKRKKPRPPKKR
jgi:hypothetical protein